jgi:quinol monooxygenase YgiN
MVVGVIRIPVSLKRRAAVLEVLRSVQGPVLAQPGCQAFQISEEETPERAIIVIDRWESDNALEAYIRSEAYRRILGALELSGGPPEMSYHHVSTSDGMELVERLRSVNGGN